MQVGLGCCLALLASLATSPGVVWADEGPLSLRLALENDNLLLGAYGRLAGGEHDGTDMGCTHGLALSGRYRLADRLDVRLSASTRLFTRSADGSSPQWMATVPIHFNELDRLRLGAALHAPGAPWRVRVGIGADVSNREAVFALGATGQQRWWHELNRSLGSSVWLFDYLQDGVGVRVGLAGDARAGGRTVWALAPWSWLAVRGEGGLRVGSLPGASWIETRGGALWGVGDPRGVRLLLGVEQRAYLWLDHPGAMLRSTASLRADFGPCALEVAVHRYDGDQNATYFVYAFPNTTMTIALSGRF